MPLLGVHLGAQTAQVLRLLRGEMALAGFAFACALFMVEPSAVGLLEASVFLHISWIRQDDGCVCGCMPVFR